MKIGDGLFGCRHKRTSFPRTMGTRLDRSANRQTGTYVVCLDCGKEFGYDWEEMRILGPLPQTKYGELGPIVTKRKMPFVSLILSVIGLTGLTDDKKQAA